MCWKFSHHHATKSVISSKQSPEIKKQPPWQLKVSQVIHKENEIGLAFFFPLFLYYDLLLKKDFKDCFKCRFFSSHEKIRD